VTGKPAGGGEARSGLIHVAGIIDAAETAMLIDSGVRYLGFPLVLGYHREDIGAEDAAAVVARFGDRATFFLITYLDAAGEIVDLCRRLGVGMAQLHGNVSVDEVARLRRSAPGLRIIKSLVVRAGNPDALADAVQRYAPMVDAFITDTFDPETGASGATGRTHDWRVSRRLVECSPKPVILAGGLTPENVRDAIRTVRPAGVDVHTGIEGPDGRKRRDLVEAFVAEARAGFTAVGV
jgi:phosphoribosylanthranilate isomerase